MVKTAKATAQVPTSATTASKVFAGANGVANPVTAAAMVAFINANGGIANLALQLNASLVKNNILFGGGALWCTMQPNNAGVIAARGLILWACVNGVKQGQPVTKANLATLVQTTVPTKFAPVPLAQIQQAHKACNAGVTHNHAVPAGGTANQNAVLAILNGGFGYSNQTLATYGKAYGQLVPLA